tara:strand:- start:156 stop:1166 length:1011 start_codon:yes stop_codon:yes gene_type:complete
MVTIANPTPETTATTGPTTAPNAEEAAFDLVGAKTGIESSLSNWAGPYVTEMLGQGQALSQTPFEAYTGPLTAGASANQQSAFDGIAGLTLPTDSMGAFTPSSFTDEGTAQNYMNPYIMQALQPQIDEARRQAEIQRVSNAGQLTKAGAYGGGRQAVMDSEGDRNLLQNLSSITGAGYLDAYNNAQNQFNTEQSQGLTAQTANNQYGLSALDKLADLGAVERGIDAEGIAADKAQFEFEQAFPYKQLQFQQSLLQGLPLKSQDYTYAEPSKLSNLMTGAGGISNLYNEVFGGTSGGITDILSGGIEGVGDYITNLFSDDGASADAGAGDGYGYGDE